METFVRTLGADSRVPAAIFLIVGNFTQFPTLHTLSDERHKTIYPVVIHVHIFFAPMLLTSGLYI
jgi:hypothetical protein